MVSLTQEMHKIFDKFPFGFTIWEKRGNKIYSLYRNPASEKLLGVKKEEYLGKSFLECYPDKPEYEKRGLSVLEKGEVMRVEDFSYIKSTKDGQFRFTLFRIDEETLGVIIEPLRKCNRTNRDGTPCPHMAVLGHFCMKHALTQLRRG